MRNTTTDAEVVYVDGDGAHHKAKITEVIGQGSVRLELGPDKHAIATYSEAGTPGSYHYPDQTEAVKKASAKKGQPPPTTASPK